MLQRVRKSFCFGVVWGNFLESNFPALCFDMLVFDVFAPLLGILARSGMGKLVFVVLVC